MDNTIGKLLIDILNCIAEIDLFFVDYPKKFDDYCQNVILKRAVERNLEIIGEAVNKILQKLPDIEIDNARKIVQLRNLIIHSYDNISDANIWAVVINHLPKLKLEVDKIVEINFPNYPKP